MSIDGRNGPPGEGGPETGGPPQVPEQGGRADVPREGPPPEAVRPGGFASGGVPAQRGPDEGEGVLPPPRDLPPSDAELIGRMRAGDDSAYEELFRRHADAVRRYARTCCRDAHTADDLTAEVFARVLQAVRGGSGPEYAVRAYLLTSVRRVAAGWTRSAGREHLVDDFAVFATQSARSSAVSEDETLELGADVRAMHEAEQSMAMRAFRSLPERWQAVLWHTEVEDESPSEVATLFGLDANGTRVLASRAREGLKQAYLQAHVSDALAAEAGCARWADQLGTYARGRLRTRAERGLRKHLEECARCRLAASQIAEVANGIPAVVPVAVIGWFGAAGYAKAAGLVAGGGTAASAVGAAGAAAAGGSSGGSGGAAASEGLGAPVKAGIASGVVAVAAAAALALALAGNDSPAPPPAKAHPPASAPVVHPAPDTPAPPAPSPVSPRPPARPPAPPPPAPPSPTPTKPTPPAPPAPKPAPPPPKPTATRKPPLPTPPAPTPPPPSPSPTPTPPAPPAVYQWNELAYDVGGDGTGPEMRLAQSSWVWQRTSLSIGGEEHAHGVTVRGRSSATIDLNRACTAYDALVGVDDLSMGLGELRFTVLADGTPLWTSGPVRGGTPAVPVHVDITGHKTLTLTVEPSSPLDEVVLADWAESRFTCE
ncbi:sigma-70 family RNA polymerase sigma factor [Streptomyces sp. SHP 1-2]|uniref:sigma-70 family RNA polymerase sigma factor n=1 Tax=Streptomyces sp. SHP 1-2 TaxID=2769489 RepID=UPI00223839FF|nr:sigma-70 family RNA polymerase sigma factor [Streptomyces sp. SHP 1-2]MCW5250185.1 sigma-70 family RNA polymerase sigma factor [Streptomyces sp. SHP 1-2]